jgi:hypothetical protein
MTRSEKRNATTSSLAKPAPGRCGSWGCDDPHRKRIKKKQGLLCAHHIALGGSALAGRTGEDCTG